MEYSIIIPAYQCEKTIEETVQSIINSGLVSFEIIIVDDGSKDGTVQVCQKLVEKFSNILYVYQENAGVSAARNHGLRLACGKYVWFVDSDDTVDCNSLIKVVQIITMYQPDILIFGMSFDYYHHGRMYRRDNIGYSCETMYFKQEISKHFQELYNSNALTSSCNKIIRRSILLDNQIFYSEQMFIMEDFLFSLDLLKVCNNMYIIPDAIYRYRQSNDEGNAYRRMKRINNLSEYMIPFKERLIDYPSVLVHVYFMLLRQKLWFANIAEVKEIAENHKHFLIEPIDRCNMQLSDDLKKGRYYKIYINNKGVRIRHYIANILKRTSFYQRIKHK